MQSYIGDFYCDLVNYRPECDHDGGDCDDEEDVIIQPPPLNETEDDSVYDEILRGTPDTATVEPDCKYHMIHLNLDLIERYELFFRLHLFKLCARWIL